MKLNISELREIVEAGADYLGGRQIFPREAIRQLLKIPMKRSPKC